MAASSIEPTTSAKRTVTCLRSPTARLGLTADPQASQKRADARRPFPQTPQHRSDPPSTGSTPTPYPTDDQLEHPTVALPPGWDVRARRDVPLPGSSMIRRLSEHYGDLTTETDPTRLHAPPTPARKVSARWPTGQTVAISIVICGLRIYNLSQTSYTSYTTVVSHIPCHAPTS